jgi:hypothetical protein
MTADAVEILVVIAVIAFGFLVVTVFYESLAMRDVYVGRVMRAARRRRARPGTSVVLYLLAVGVGIPVLVVVWASVPEPLASPAFDTFLAAAPTGEPPP